MQTDIRTLMQRIDRAKTPYHTVELCAQILEAQGFSRLDEASEWQLVRGGRYFAIRDGGAMVAFCIGKQTGGFRIVASHTDSPCLKIKGEKPVFENGYLKWNVERYGGTLLYSWLDIPLVLAGREVRLDPETGSLQATLVEETRRSVIPSLAIHFQREANAALSLNAQSDMQPVLSLDAAVYEVDESVLGRDLYLVNATAPYLAGGKDELLVSPRLDNLVSVFASVEALSGAGDSGISMILLADNEEVGSHTKQGADSDILSRTMHRIAESLGESMNMLLSQSFLVSCDGAHAVHPNHPEKSDSANPVRLGGGVVVKHHAGKNYTTDGFSEAVVKAIMQKADVPYQNFYMRADMPCGSTLGAISATQVSVRSVDIGIPQLAMHAATETMGVADYGYLVRALHAFFASDFRMPSYNTGVLK
ncbi:MAG: M18 family aminopeptidase [Clostridia bacterium]|nr:M18 family aminopeptidase [Clostridia bacterium]